MLPSFACPLTGRSPPGSAVHVARPAHSILDFARNDKLSSCRRGFPFSHHRVNAPLTRPVEEEEQKAPAIKHCRLALVEQWKELFDGVRRVIECFTGRV